MTRNITDSEMIRRNVVKTVAVHQERVRKWSSPLFNKFNFLDRLGELKLTTISMKALGP